MQGEAKGESPPYGSPSMPTTHPLTLEGCHHSFHEVPTCSMCNQEDEGQLSGHLIDRANQKNSTKGVKITC